MNTFLKASLFFVVTLILSSIAVILAHFCFAILKVAHFLIGGPIPDFVWLALFFPIVEELARRVTIVFNLKILKNLSIWGLVFMGFLWSAIELTNKMFDRSAEDFAFAVEFLKIFGIPYIGFLLGSFAHSTFFFIQYLYRSEPIKAITIAFFWHAIGNSFNQLMGYSSFQPIAFHFQYFGYLFSMIYFGYLIFKKERRPMEDNKD